MWLTSAFGLKSEALDVASHLPFRLAASVLIGIHTSVYGYKRMVNRKKTTFDDLWILTCIQSGYHGKEMTAPTPMTARRNYGTLGVVGLVSPP